MINKLTQQQISQFSFYKEKWLKIGLSTEQVTINETINYIHRIYPQLLSKQKLPIIILMDNPITAWYAVCLLNKQVRSQVRSQVESQVWSQVRSQVGSQVGSQVRSQVENQVENQVEGQVENQVWSQIRSQVWNQIRSQVENQVESQVGNQVWSQIRSQVENFVWPYIDGQFSSVYFSFYDYFENILGNFGPLWNLYKESTKFGLIYPFDNYCIVSQKPTSIKMKNGQLHCETGPSIKYNGDFKIYSLNGVKVSKEIVMTQWNKLDSNLILKETNAEVRREIVKKIGIEKVCKDLNAQVIDKKDNYELLNLKISDNNYRPYLKMKNPSIGVYHIEGVDSSIKTVEEALNYRKPKGLKEIPVSDNGSDWFQQGDVCIWNKDAKFVKPQPTILT